uniref:FAD synthase n=2 Tax=Nelumbo nucifera TaxID=4432 RepID=A0A822Y0V8_NELNU|nr:TPA_asm: hypothetical protein HUJ06_029012 [Nelumbo nucifera]
MFQLSLSDTIATGFTAKHWKLLSLPPLSLSLSGNPTCVCSFIPGDILFFRMASGFRVRQHLTGCKLGLCSRIQLCSSADGRNAISSALRSFGGICEKHLQRVMTSTRASGILIDYLQARSLGSALADGLSQQEDDRDLPSEGSSSVAGGIVALGKFDALHVGQQQLAIQASKAGVPFLLSFVGVEEVLGRAPRVPIVAKCDRKRVLSTWAPYCGNVVPAEHNIEFSSVRHLTPRQFVEKLAKELGVRGVVAGENYRFGYRAAGDAFELVRLCEEFGMRSYIVSSIMDKNQCSTNKDFIDSKDKGQVSSTRVRHYLSEGNMKHVSELLGRKHRLILKMTDQEGLVITKNRMSASRLCLLNLPPKDGVYENCSLLVGDNIFVPCRTIIETTWIHVELDGEGAWTNVFQDCRFITIEFDDKRVLLD